MSDQVDSSTLRLDDADETWELLADRVEAFIDAWESTGGPPTLSEFALSEPPAARHLVLVELVKVDLEYRWNDGQATQQVEDYVAEFPELAGRNGVPADLLYEEFHIRKRCGDTVAAESYFERFPKQEDELRRLLGLEQPEATTCMFGGGHKRPDGLQAGEEVDDFELVVQLGKGSFASVFLARQKSLARMVALKISAIQGVEAKTLVQLDHPNIVRVYDQRDLADRGLRLMYMQYVNGGTLQQALRWARQVPAGERRGKTLFEAVDQELDQRGDSPRYDSSARRSLGDAGWPTVVCWTGLQLAKALDYAHKKGVMHRDLKPANVLLTDEGVPKLVDFNISSSAIDGAGPAAYFGGTLAYMSPEQLEAYNPRHPRRPDSLDGRSDIYALGVVLWEMLVGTRPFASESMEVGWIETLVAMTRRRREGVSGEMLDSLPADCPPGMVDAIRRCLAGSEGDRFADAGELAQHLRLCLQPEAQRLLRPATSGWKGRVRRHAVLAMLVASLVPNLAAAAFNLYYNRTWLEARHGEAATQAFMGVMAMVNGTAFPIGVLIVVLLQLPIHKALKQFRAGAPPPDDQLPQLRERALRMGHYTALVGIVLWMIAGPVYPIAINVAGVPLHWRDAVHFIGSLTLGGLIASAYPFFNVTFLSVRAWYPALVRPGSASPADLAALGWLYRKTWLYLLLGFSLPILTILVLVLLFLSGTSGVDQVGPALGMLSAISLVGCLILWVLARAIQSDLTVLSAALNPPEDSMGLGTESLSYHRGLG